METGRVRDLRCGADCRGWAALMIPALVVGLLLATPDAVKAQTYPDKPIRFILPFAPGGGTDIVGRIIALKLGERLGQPMVPENRPGGGSHVGIAFGAKAKPDGYTLFIAAPEITTGPSLYKRLNYDPTKDLTPISMAAQIPYVMTVSSSLPVKTLKEFIEFAKASPGKINYGSPGVGSLPHIAVELLKSLTKIDIVHVAYKGAGPALTGLLGGEVAVTVQAIAPALPQIQAGKLKALAVLDKERAPSLPQVPTSKEAGLESWTVTLWWGIFAPGGTPREIVNRLNAEWIKTAALPDTQEKMRTAGFELLTSTPEHLSEFIKTEIVRWSGVIKEANIPPMD